ncbi:peroxidase 2-like [Miscanthus floridulus]|uniref:peroxidase 2-like n=1 Tax=Miscanthus floridulus TaxID=154761 RepID=UPI0034585F7D
MDKLAALAITLLGLLGSVACHQGLTVGYYNKSGTPYYCPIVKKAVEKAIKENPGIGAGLVRLFFHDCFVRPPQVRGDIDAAKAELENNPACRGKVSCADNVAFATRDAARNLSYGAIDFAMPAGRLDGRVSLKAEAERNLLWPFDTLDDLEKSFAEQGLDPHDMITLSGAHSFGVARCRFFGNRLPPSNTSDMDHDLANSLNVTCKSNGPDFRVVQDPVTSVALDNQYYKNVHSGKVLFTSDAGAQLHGAERAPLLLYYSRCRGRRRKAHLLG